MKTPIAYPGMKAEDRPMGDAPLSAAILSEPMLFLSGQVSIDPYTAQIVGTDVATQTRQIIQNMQDLLKSADMTLENLVKVTIFLTDLSRFDEMNKVYSEMLTFPYPARATVGATLNNSNLLLEMEAIAMR